MWPFRAKAPDFTKLYERLDALERDNQGASRTRALGALEERVEQLELASAERNLQVLEVAERVSFRLKERTKKRQPDEPADDGNPYDRIRARRAARGIP